MNRQHRTGSRALMILVFLFLYAPILILIVFSFNEGNSNAVWQGFSLRWYEALFHNKKMMEAVSNTLLIAILATVISTIAGTFAAIGLFNIRRRWREPLNTVGNIPMMNADIVTGVSLCLLFVAFIGGWNTFAQWVEGFRFTFLGSTFRVLMPRLEMGFWTLLLAHIVFDIPHIILTVTPKLRQMDKNLVDAAQDLGCTWFRAFRKVILPEIKPGIVSGALIAFTMSIDDFVISYFTRGNVSILSAEIYSEVRRKVSPEVNAVSSLLFITVLVLLLVNNIREAQAEMRVAQRNCGAPTAL